LPRGVTIRCQRRGHYSAMRKRQEEKHSEGGPTGRCHNTLNSIGILCRSRPQPRDEGLERNQRAQSRRVRHCKKREPQRSHSSRLSKAQTFSLCPCLRAFYHALEWLRTHKIERPSCVIPPFLELTVIRSQPLPETQDQPSFVGQ